MFQDRNSRTSISISTAIPIGPCRRCGPACTVADIYNVKPDLSAFRARGGKLIMYHGWADEQVTPFASLDLYSTCGGEAMASRNR